MNLKKISYLVIIIIILVSALSIFKAKDLEFNYIIEDYFPNKNEDVAYFLEFSKQFENDIDFILIGISNKKGVFNPDFLSKIQLLTDSIGKHSNIKQVISPTNIKKSIITNGGFYQVLLLHLNDYKKLSQDSVKIMNDKTMVGSFFASNGSALMLYIRNKQNLNRQQSDSLYQFVSKQIRTHNFDEIHIMGRIRAQSYYVSQMSKEIAVFTFISVLMLVSFMYAIFKNGLSIVVAFFVISLSVLWTIALVLTFEENLNLMMTLLPTLLFVIGMSDVVHILTKYYDELKIHNNKILALKNTFKEVGLATFLTSLTTAIGFITLITSEAPPIRYFGIYTAIGVFITYLVSITLLPSMLFLFKKPDFQQTELQQIKWQSFLRKMLLFTIRNQKKIIFVSIFISVISVIGIYNVQINNYFLEDLDDKSELKKDLNFFETNFSGIRPLEIGISITDTSKNIYNHEIIREIEKVENFVLENYKAGMSFSLVQTLKALNQSLHSGLPTYYTLPTSDKELKNLIAKAHSYGLFAKQTSIISKDKKKSRISLKMYDIGSNKQKILNDNFFKFIEKEANPKLVSFHLTGVGYLLDETNRSISKSLILGLFLAAIIIGVVMAIVLKSLKMFIISLIPNVLPLILIGGFIGFLNYDIKISTAIIFTIAFGICVDDTIHFLSKLKIELSKGKSLIYAIKRTYLSTGKAIIITSILLSCGFLTFILSDFGSTVQIGLLISITLVFAVLADMFLLPVLLLWFFKK